MSDIGLSQAEIDALLGGGSTEVSAPAAGPGGPERFGFSHEDTSSMSAFESDALGNLSGVVNAMTGFEYGLDGVELAAVTADEIPALLGDDLVYEIPVTVGSEHKHFLVLEPAFAKQVAAALTGGDPGGESGTLSELEVSAVNEVISTINGTYVTNLASALKVPTNAGTPKQAAADAASAALSSGGLIATLKLSQNGDSPTPVRHVMPASLATTILNALRPPAAPSPQPAAPAAAARPASAPAAPASKPVAPEPSYAPAAFSQLGPAPMPDIEMRNLDLLLDVPLTITVELGKTVVPIRQILEYGQGSLIALDKLAGEPIDLLVNGKYFARGEVVVIDENFGVRLTSIVSPSERLSQLT